MTGEEEYLVNPPVSDESAIGTLSEQALQEPTYANEEEVAVGETLDSLTAGGPDEAS